MTKQPVPKEITDALNIWDRLARNLRRLSIVLGVVSIVCSVVVTTFNEQLGTIWTKVFAATSALSLGFLTGFSIGEKSNDTRNAYRHLRLAITKYQTEDNYSITDLTKAYGEAEAMLGHPVITVSRVGQSSI
jgi:hypothetical protein